MSGDNNYNKENKKSLLDAINVAGVLVKRECGTKSNGKIGPVLNEARRYEIIRESTTVAPRSLHFGSTVELHLSGRWLSG